MLTYNLGNVDIKHVNIKPDKANEFINKMPIPFSLKAGMIGKLSIKVCMQIKKICFNMSNNDS